MGGKTWIIEIKGSFNASGGSENIDVYATKKAAALKAYCANHGISGGVVCHDVQTCSLLISTDGFSESIDDTCWKRIEDVVG